MPSILSFQVSPKSNILDGITLNEKIDRSTLTKLINSTLLKETFNNVMARIYANERTQLTAYLSLLVNGTIPITYQRNENNPYGRSNPLKALGLFPIRREIRHTLASSLMADLDIKNCHPEMLLQLCRAEGYECSELEDYVANRQVFFDQGINAYGCSQDEIKRLFIIYLYAGGFDNWASDLDAAKCSPDVVDSYSSKITELDSFRLFRESIAPLHRRIAEANPHLCGIVADIKLDKGLHQYNLNGSVCSFVLQEYELRVLEQLFLYCSHNGLIENGVCVLCADGLMIQRKHYNPQLLDAFNILINEKLGFNLTFTEKAMTQGYVKILDKNLNFDLINPTFSSGMLADYFSVLYPQFVSIDGNVFEYNGVYWKLMDKKLSSLHLFINDVFYKHLIGYATKKQIEANQQLTSCTPEKQKNIDETITRISAFIKNVQTLRKLKARRELVEDITIRVYKSDLEFDVNPYLLAFENKIYDLQKNTFVKPEPSQWIHTTCGYDYDEHYSQQRVDTMRSIMQSIFPDKAVRDYYLSVLATGLSGIRMENIFISTGSGGNGKSLVNGMMMETLGEYSYKLPSAVLMDALKTGANPEVANLHRKRFVLAQEPPPNRPMCASTLKEITGDKGLNVRFMHSDKCKVSLNITLAVECNDIPDIPDKSADAIPRRLRIVPFDITAVPQAEYDGLEDKTGYCIQNSEYKKYEWQEAHRQALFELLLPHWRALQDNKYELPIVPEACKLKTNMYLESNDPLYSWFSDNYEKGSATTDYIYIDTLFPEYLSAVGDSLSKEDKKKLTKKKFNTEIEGNRFLRSSFKQRDTSFNKKQHKKTYLVGYRKITVVEELDITGCILSENMIDEL